MNKSPSNTVETTVQIIGAGLAGSEAAYFLAQRGVSVILHEMRPKRMTEAHHTGDFAELVCSNSFKSQDPTSAPGMLKSEMREMGSLVLKTATQCEVPSGQALSVDRTRFSKIMTETLKSHPLIEVREDEVITPTLDKKIPTLIATGPLTSDGLSQWLAQVTGAEDLYFYDAIAPIVETSSLLQDQLFLANRHDKGGEAAYLNCPMDEAQYNAFVDALLAGQKVAPKSFEKEKFFQGCQPIEAIAASGRDSLRFGPMKPVGLINPTTGKRPYAVLQLRPENNSLTAYNMVGFQTKLKYGEQQRIFRMIPALAQVEFLRLGSIHRNTYVCGPRVLRPDLSLKGHPTVYLAGQITGVEGYLESAACGLLAACFIYQRLTQREHISPSPATALGALLRYITASDPKNFQPGNMQFGIFELGLFDGLEGLKKDQIRAAMLTQAAHNFGTWWNHADSLHA